MHHDTAWPAGTPCWIDLSSPDIDAAVAFYSALFGWEVAEGRPEFGGYRNAAIDGRLVCGLLPQMAEGQPTMWTPYLATADAAATAEAITASGGSLIAAPMDVMELGTMTIGQGPDGGVFGTWQAGTHLGFGLANEPGSVIWNELLTPDYERTKDFYSTVFGYDLNEIGDGGEFRYSTIAVGGNVVGGIAAADVPMAYWRNYFNCADTDQAVTAAVALGGSVVLAAHDSPFGRWATLADPLGAEFAVIASSGE